MSVPTELPEQPQLRAAAAALERAQIMGYVLDHKWRNVFISSEQSRRSTSLDRSTCQRV